jgi:DNA-binding beta-propeller fold protein YncE
MTNRSFLLGLLALWLGACSDGASGSPAASADGPEAGPADAPSSDAPAVPDAAAFDSADDAPPASGTTRLVVADPPARKLYVVAVPQWTQLAELTDVGFDSHAGFLPLPTGHLLFVDPGRHELVALDATADAPAIVSRAAVPEKGVAHLAVDPSAKWAAVSASGTDGGKGSITLVDLATWTAKKVELSTGEPGLALGSDPVHLYHRNDSPPQVEAYRLTDLLAGKIELAGSSAIGEAPHGEVIAHALGKIVVAADDGMNVLPVQGATFGAKKVVPYAVSGRTGGRAFYARLSADGRHLYSYLRTAPAKSTWKDWSNDLFVVDLAKDEAKRIPVGNGLVYRLADSPKLALFVQYSPSGDQALLLDADPASPTFQTVTAKVPLAALTKAPGPDGDVWSSDAFRIAGMTPDGAFGFVTHGGDGRISVIDTGKKEVVRTIEVATKLDGGGYVVGVTRGAPLVDTIGR